MKKTLLCCCLLFCLTAPSQNVGIGTTTPAVTAMVDISSTSKGLLVPRMTAVQRIAISAPDEGLLVYQTDTPAGFYFYKGSSWVYLLSGQSGWSLTGNAGTVDGSNFIGTTDNVPFSIRVNNKLAGRIDPAKQSTFFGYGAGALLAPSDAGNTIIGDSALAFAGTVLQTTAVGTNALKKTIWGGNSTAIGFSALQNNTTGINNTATGFFAMLENIDGQDNTATGFQALFNNNTGDANTAMGYQALPLNTSGGSNTGIGVFALLQSSSGSSNTAIGVNAMQNLTSGSFNSALGSFANVSNNALSNVTVIGYQAVVNASNKVRLGNTFVTSIEGQVPYSFPSDGRFKNNISENDVKGLDFIKRLRPVVYNFDTRKFTEFINKDISPAVAASYADADYAPSSAIRQSGFIAQEVEQAAKESGYNFNGLHRPANEGDHYTLAYSQFVVPLVKGMQEQQDLIEKQQKEINELKKLVTLLLNGKK